VLVLAVLMLVELRLSAMKTTSRPTPIISTASRPPSTHQIALDRFRGAGGGVGVHCCGGGGGGAMGLAVGAVGAGR
jgi:hypothetical protein